jgi:hypothetical protein
LTDESVDYLVGEVLLERNLPKLVLPETLNEGLCCFPLTEGRISIIGQPPFASEEALDDRFIEA